MSAVMYVICNIMSQLDEDPRCAVTANVFMDVITTCRLSLQWWSWCPKIPLLHITTHYCAYHNHWARCNSSGQSFGSPGAACRNHSSPNETRPGKEEMYVLPITSIPFCYREATPASSSRCERRAGLWGGLPGERRSGMDHPVRQQNFGCRSGCRNGAHRYNHDLTSADSSRGAGDCWQMYFVNSWALGWSSYPWSAINCPGCGSCYYHIGYYYVFLQIHCYILLHHYYIIIASLLRLVPLQCYSIIITLYHIGYYYVLLRIRYYVLLHHYYIIVTSLVLISWKSCNYDSIITCCVKSKAL